MKRAVEEAVALSADESASKSIYLISPREQRRKEGKRGGGGLINLEEEGDQSPDEGGRTTFPGWCSDLQRFAHPLPLYPCAVC